MAKLLVVDDNPTITELLKVNLELQGYTVLVAHNAFDALAYAQQDKPHLAILDLMMPEVDGFTLCQRIRKLPGRERLPILMLTALSSIEDKGKGFESGADDYLTKPFDVQELLMRVRALLRRVQATPETAILKEILTVGDFTLIPDSLEVNVQQHRVKLTPTEFDILNCLIQHHEQTVSLSKLLKDVWGYSPDDDVETIRVHIRHLRSKLEKVAPDTVYIETIYGGGYRLWATGKA
ncbi:MAG: response regulator transcription factor [Vampirovibrionales bacterium]